MFGKSVRLFRILGFEVRADLSWIVIAVLITWSLASGVFPHYYEGLSSGQYWWMGIVGAFGLFGSIIFHELSHSLVARRHGMPMKGITLFIFGGVAHMSDEPPDAKSEFAMAFVGPLSSILIGVVFLGFAYIANVSNWSTPVYGVIRYLGVINLLLAGFNLLPAFPLDGGRVLRSILWRWKNNVRWATRVASSIGSAFGIALIVLGAFTFITGGFIAGMWWFLIGMFIRNASQTSYMQLLYRKNLEGEPVKRFMKTEPVTVSPSTSLEDMVEDYIYKYHYKMFPVVADDKLIGCVTINQIKSVSRDDWGTVTAGDLAEKCSEDNTIGPDEDAVRGLSIMSRKNLSRLMVVDKGKLVGVIALKDMLRFLSLKIDLEQ
jgi:Zn-dependent protease/CBS domain-containing protein